LNVFVTGENGDNPLVPNLYFSTAQMNILSLSIFLAKALNAKDNANKSVDRIFIDDPIQSMDSINILSTIDLFRSIVIKFKKQIILSTHDENFHNLLRKKIPANLFNAKYIELETFGTVKPA
jgi:exonuclease SbcC